MCAVFVQLEEQWRAQEAAAAAAAEEARERAVREEYEASLPEDIKDRVIGALAREVVSRLPLVPASCQSDSNSSGLQCTCFVVPAFKLCKAGSYHRTGV